MQSVRHLMNPLTVLTNMSFSSAVTQGLEVACLLCKVRPSPCSCVAKASWKFQKMPKTKGEHYCSRKCGLEAEAKAPVILDVPKTDPKFADGEFLHVLPNRQAF